MMTTRDRLDERGEQQMRARQDAASRRHSTAALMADYAAIGRRRPMALEATAIRTNSSDLAELIAHIASDGAVGAHELVEMVRAGDAELALEPEWVARLGRVIALAPSLDASADGADAIELLRFASSRIDRTRPNLRFRRLLVELLYAAGRFAEARDELELEPGLTRIDQGYLATDLLNPFSGSPFADEAAWLRGINRHFAANKMEKIALFDGPGVPFDNVVCLAPAGSVRGPLVSVIVTAYNPPERGFRTSVESILSQTYADLEVLIVDDASDASSRSFIESLTELDPRVRLLSAKKNGGTYLARNLGFEAAQGVYVTGQDSDDWSHPRRIERQVALLESQTHLPGVRAAALFVDETLVANRVGYTPRAPHAPSLMARTSDLVRLGGYLPARRAADNELHRRLEAAYGEHVLEMKAPLSLYRVLKGSLSRSDFRAGWRHPARSAFTQSYTSWHSSAAGSWEALRSVPDTPAVPIPSRFEVVPREKSYDVVFAADWRQNGGPQKSILEEINALRSTGLRLGVLHFEAARFMSVKAGTLCAPVQTLIDQGVIDRVLPDERAEVGLLVLRYPPILQFVTGDPIELSVGRMVILANQAPSERDGSDIRYRVEDCTRNARRLFGVDPLWVPQGPTVRQILTVDVAAERLAPYDMPGIIDLDAWWTPRGRFRSDRPVIGRHSRDNVMKWPELPADLAAAYPLDGSADVRVMGGGATVRSILDLDRDPDCWVVFGVDEMPVRAFLNSIDFFVYFQNSTAYDAFGRSILEAAAAGAVPVLPHHFRDTFGPAALYTDVTSAMQVVRALYADPEAYARQVEIGREFVAANFGYAPYRELVAQLLAAPSFARAEAP